MSFKMDLKTIIDDLVSDGINLQLQGEDLVINGMGGSIPDRVLKLVKDHKSELVAHLKSNVSVDNNRSLIRLAKENADGYPLSSSQRRLWIVSQIEGANKAYNIPGMFVFSKGLNIELLEKSFNIVIDRHESLRTVFREINGELRQVIIPTNKTGFKIGFLNLSDHPEQGVQLQALINEQISQSFDLENGPLIRAMLYQLDSDQIVLNYVIHHIIFDGWSMKILISELTQIYNSLVAGKKILMQPLTIQYKDYATWQQQQIHEKQYTDHKDYWLQKFSGELPVLDLAVDKVRPAIKTYNGETVTKHFNAFVTSKLRALTQERGATLFMGLLAAFNTLFFHHTGQNDIVIGSQIAGRENREFEKQIGNYLNALPLRTKFSGNDSFKKLLSIVKQTTLEAYEHQSYPFDDLVESLNLQYDAGRNPLFDVTMILQITDLSKLNPHEDFGSIHVYDYVDNVDIVNTISKFDLSIDVSEYSDSLKVSITYNTDLYHKKTVVQLLNHLEQLIVTVVNNPHQPLNELDFLTEDEKKVLLKTFNSDRVRQTIDATIPSLFAEQVQKNPDYPAVIANGKTLTYRQLDLLSDKIAFYLQDAQQLKPEQSVGIMLGRSEFMVISILGILKSGGSYVPIDPDYPKARKEYILTDAGISVLITEMDFFLELDYYGGEVFIIDAQLDTLPVQKPSAISISPQSLAYTMYTSGSTGLPKGTLIEHGNIIRLVKDTNYIEIAEGDTIINLSSFAFDASVFDVFGAVLNGACIVIPAKEHLLDLKNLTSSFTTYHVSVVFITTALFNILVDDDVVEMTNVKYLLFGGERVSVGHVKRFKAKYPHVNLLHVYGPTENTTFSTYYHVAEVTESQITIPIGGPISNSTCYVLNEINGRFHIAPLGVAGEICVGGKGLARGYLNQPQLTEEKFVQHPFIRNERIYRTGDLGRWLPDGSIEFIGRRDNQIKIRGHRIEPGEIESALLGHPLVESAVVTVKPDGNGGLNLVAYLVAGCSLNLGDLGSYLKQNLPNYMIPFQYFQIDKLPLNSNGKVDKNKLMEYEGVQLTGETEQIEPETSTQKELAKIWKEVLRLDSIGIKDDYFELGGNSLTGMVIVKKVRDVMQVNLSVNNLFSLRNIKLIADYLDANILNLSLNPVSLTNSVYLSELSYNQLNYFCDWQFGSDLVVKYFRQDAINIAALQAALIKFVQRHEIFRTKIVREDDGLMQNILPINELDFKIEVIPVGYEFDINDQINKEDQKKIDPQGFPLVFVKVYLYNDGAGYVVLTMHHIIVDGVSVGILQDELKSLYHSELTRSESLLATPVYQYKDYANWQRQFIRSAEGKAHSDYWLSRLAGGYHGVVIQGLDNSKTVSDIMLCTDMFVEGELISKIQNFVKKQGITVPVLLLGVLNLVVNYLTNQSDIIIHTTVSGRNSKYLGQLAANNIVGIFANPLFIRTQVNKSQSISAYLQNLLQDFSNDLNYESYPMMKLLEELPGIVPTEIVSKAIAFNYHNYDYMRESLFALSAMQNEDEIYEVQPIKGSLGIIAEEYSNGLKIQFLFNNSFFEKTDVTLARSVFLLILEEFLDRPDFSINQLSAYLNQKATSSKR